MSKREQCSFKMQINIMHIMKRQSCPKSQTVHNVRMEFAVKYFWSGSTRLVGRRLIGKATHVWVISEECLTYLFLDIYMALSSIRQTF